MLLTKFKLFSLKHQNWLDLAVQIWVEMGNAFVSANSKLKHIQQMLWEISANNKVIWSFLLVGAQDKKTGVLFVRHLFQWANVFEGVDVMTLPHEQLTNIRASESVQILNEVRNNLARFITFH